VLIIVECVQLVFNVENTVVYKDMEGVLRTINLEDVFIGQLSKMMSKCLNLKSKHFHLF